MRGASAISALCNWCEITAAKTDAKKAVADHADPSERLLRLDWSLRHGPSGTDAVRISKTAGAFAFETVPLSDLPKSPKGDRDDRVDAAISARLQATPGRPVTVAELVASAHAACGGRKLSDTQMHAACSRLREAGQPVTAGAGAGAPSWVWDESLRTGR